MLNLEMKRLHDDAVMPSRAHKGDAGLDLSSIEDVVVPAGNGRVMVKTGIAIAVPMGYAGLVYPRSGNAAKFGITLSNAVGVIDHAYRGELCILLQNTDPDNDFHVKKGDRIAQLILTPVALPVPLMVEELSETDRGAGGFGSSGTN